MKKFFYAAMAVALAFANVACSDDDDPADNGDVTGGGDEVVEVVKKDILYSFTQKNYVLGESVELTVELLDRTDASAIIADEDIPVTLVVKEGSTAVKDDNFTIESETAIVRKGTNKCTFKLTSIPDDEAGPAGQAEEDEVNKIIVLGLQFDGDNYIAGQFPEATVTMVGSMVNDLYGTWVMNELVTDKDYMFEANWEMVNFDDGFPVFNENDKFVFDSSNKLTTELYSDWKNYFQSESGFTFVGEMLLHVDNLLPPTTVTVQLLELDNVNRYFSADENEQSEDKTALIGVRNITGGNGETLLDVYVIDYESHSFAPEFMEWAYSEQKPVAAMAGTLINFTMKKAQ